MAGGAALFPLVVACVLRLTWANPVPTYFVTSPNLLHVGVDETVVVVVHEVEAPVDVTVALKSADKKKTLSSKVLTCPPDDPQTQRIRVTLGDLGDLGEEAEETLTVWLTASSTSPALSFTKETQLLVTRRAGYVFLQLDKTIYHPYEKIQARVYNTDEHLKASPRPIRLEFKDPDGKVLSRQDKKAKADYPGIVQYSPAFTIPQIATLGEWTATAYYGDKFQFKKEVAFEVTDYVLPTYDVSVTFDDIITPGSKQVSGIIGAKYTYGKPVRGNINITYSLVFPDKTVDFFYAAGHITDGKYYFRLDINKIKGLRKSTPLWFPEVLQKQLKLLVTARVRERATGKKEEGSARLSFAKSNFVISFERTLKYFKPALPFVVNVDVKSHKVLLEADRRIPISIQAYAVSPAKRQELGLYQQGEAQIDTSEDGQAKITIDNVPRDAKTLEIRVRTNYNQKVLENAESLMVVRKQQSDSPESYILLRVLEQEIQVGDSLEVQVFSSLPERSRLNYFVLAQGQVLGAKTIVGEAGILQTLRIPILHQMSPHATLVVYYYVFKGGKTIVIADSVHLKVKKVCRNKVSLEDTAGRAEYRPGENFNLLIRGTPESNVALLAVDQAVYLLREEGVLARHQLFDDISQHSLSCGVGGGQNTPAVFKDAGVAILSNAHVTSSKRDQEFCPKPQVRKKRATGITDDVMVCCRQGGKFDGNCREEAFGRTISGEYSVDCVQAFFNCCLANNTTTKTPLFKANRGPGGRAGARWHLSDDIFNINTDVSLAQLRLQFSEAWLWEIYKIGQKGVVKKTITLKDSITEWVFQGVGMSKTQGMCIAEPLNITTFQDFFIQLDLPITAVKGEQTEVKATVFNYGNERQGVKMYLEGTKDVCAGPKPGEQGGERFYIVKPNDAFTVSWPVTPLKTGTLPIKVQAFARSNSDYVQKDLRVIPAGEEKEESESVVIDPSGEAPGHVNTRQVLSDRITVIPNKKEKKQVVTIDVAKPRDYVKDSGRLALSFWGEMLGPVVEEVLSGMEQMVRLPRGCGEQTMIFLGPTVYTARYLKKTDQMTNQMETKAYDYIRKGVSHMMTFRKSDQGSFAVWANRASSSWLTAFVVKVFSQAREFNVLNKDINNTICTAVHWFCKYRNPDGSFFDPYKVHHHGDMVGGVHDKQTLTAFTLISLLEANCATKESATAIRGAVKYLEAEFGRVTRSYDAAIVAYALALADSPKKFEANNLLKSLAKFVAETNMRYWSSGAQGHVWEWALRMRRPKAPALDIETNGYALLAQVQLGDLEYSHPIVNWLLSQRGNKGAYQSTQDTVVALQALAEYRIKTQRSDLAIDVTITSDRQPNWSEQFSLTPENLLLRKQIKMSEHVGHNIMVEAIGEGVAYMDFHMLYNAKIENGGPLGEQANCKFQVTIGRGDCPHNNELDQMIEGGGRARIGGQEEEEEECTQITVSAKYLGEEPTGMVMIDVGLFTGYKAKEDDLKLIKDDPQTKISMYEVSDRVVHFYIDDIPRDQTVDVTFGMVKEFEVGNVAPVPVKVYKYYDPEVSCTKFYHPELGSPLLGYNCAGGACRCLAGECGKCYDFTKYADAKPFDYATMKMKACGVGQNADYVIKAKVIGIDFGADQVEIVTAEIDTVAKSGNDLGLIRGGKIILKRQLSCGCPIMAYDKTYIIMGMDGIPQQTPGGIKYSYYVDSDTYVTEYLGDRWRRLPGKSGRTGRMQERFLRVLKAKGCRT